MRISKVIISGTAAIAAWKIDIPTGIIGAQVQLVCADPAWETMHKTITFEGANEVEPIVDPGEMVKIPAAVVSEANTPIKIGITGVSADGSKMIPTLWAELGTTKPAPVINCEDESIPPLWAQLLTKLGDLSQLNTPSRDNLVNAINEVLAKESEDCELTDEIRAEIETILQAAKDSGEFDGPMGPQGEQGEKGDPGEPGADGKTAYQYAQDGGFTGTEEEFAELLANSVAPSMPAMVSFIDDDCRAETRTVMLPLKQDLGIPMAIACPPGNIGVTDGYMSVAQLQEMAAAGFTVSCHHWTQTNMNRYESAEAYAEDLDECLAAFEGWGISGVNTVCYPQGVYTDKFMQPVRDRFKMGFGVFPGINEVPLESYFLRRRELFPTDGSFTLQDAKDMVDTVAESGGWLVFMTHAWYPTFNADQFAELVDHIQKANVDIVGLDEAMEQIGNQAEAGTFRKPLEELTEPYFVEDVNGNVWRDGYEAAPLTLREAKVINTSGVVVSVSSGDIEYMVSDKVDISGAEAVVVSGWASDGNGLYVLYDSAGNRKDVRYSGKTYAEGGEYLRNEVVQIPDGVTHIAVAGYFRKQMPVVISVVSSGANTGYSGVHIGPEPPEDTSMLWIDTSDDSVDVTLADAEEVAF